ncbi:hypothetical protein BVC80_1787g267 [Macleaya cordata]|uniref:LIM-domain binding protein/SEUSS n=1 Tax=Macleaya cordata TaxID=56857 RepID=A0A200QUQ1_MACCD|nr:hypothetical protein BVC80_1787g267 [Macleaya cordata]
MALDFEDCSTSRRFHHAEGLALDSYLDSSHQLAVPPVAPSRVAGGPAQSSSSSGIFFQGDGQPQAVVKTLLNSSFGNSSSSISGTGRSTLVPASGDMNRTANSGPSVGASSLVTDANSNLSGGPRLQRSASINTESYLRLPASPLSFSSNNISISGSSVMDGSSVQQNSHQDQNPQQVQQRQHGGSSATSQPTSRAGQISQISVPSCPQVPSSLTQDPNNFGHVHKKPRLDIKQEDIMQQQVMQQLLQRQDQIQLQGHNPQLQTLIHQQRLMQRQQQPQQILQSMPQIQRAHLQQQLQQQQLRQHVQQGLQPVPGVKRPYESGVCARRLMQYIYHQRHRPPDNTIIYWRKFVAEYFAPRAKRRWCLSLYDNVGHHALGVFPQAAMDAWQCDICGCRSGRGFEATFEVLPRLNKIKFDSGVTDELLFVDIPRECRFPSGIMMLEYGKAVEESVYENVRVPREGQLRIIFTPELKILSWEFCARPHDELLPRRLLAPQVNNVVQVAQKYQNAVAESGSAGLSVQELQAHCNAFVAAWRHLAKHLELQSLNDLGFSKRYVRCLQISEVVGSMKDLIDFSREHNMGPIDSLKNYPRQTAVAKYQMQKMQEMEQLASAQGLPTDTNTLNRLLAMQSGLNSHMNNNNNHMVGSGVLNNSAQTAVVLNNYQNLLRQNSMNSNPNMFQQEASCSFGTSNQTQHSMPFQGPASSIQGSLQNVQVNNLSSPHHHHHQQQQQNTGNLTQQNNPQSSQGNQNLQQHMIQQLLQEMMNNSGEGRVQQQQNSGGQNVNGTMNEHVFNGVNGITTSGGGGGGGALPVKAGSTGSVGNPGGYGNNTAPASRNMGRSDSFKGTANSNNSSMAGGGANSFDTKVVSDSHFNFPDMVPDISTEFADWE